jgi:hypothetical protein
LDHIKQLPPPEPEQNAMNEVDDQPHLFKDIQRLQKKIRSHRCVMDFDGAFVKAVMKEEKEG